MTQPNQSKDQRRETFPVVGTPESGGDFEIVAISAGEGNGWKFSEDVLRRSLALFDEAQCFIDHLQPGAAARHSVRDLAGILREPRWDERTKAICCRLTPLGPAAELLKRVGAAVLAEPDIRSNVGFSADLGFSADGRVVTELKRVYSVDLVVNPARGGAFKAALEKLSLANGGEFDSLRDAFSVRGEEPERETDTEKKLCAALLDESLRAARLPAPVGDRIHAKFAGTVFSPEALRAEIEDASVMLSAMTGREAVRGVSPAASVRMTDGTDEMTAALHDLLGAERPTELSGIRTARLSRIREFYTLVTGDVDFHGGYDPNRAQFATTADLPGILKNALNKLIVQRWDELGRSGYRWWEPIVTVEHFNNLQTISGVLVGEINLLPSVNEGAPYAPLGVKESSESGSWTKYGGYLGLTIEMFERDDTLRLRQFPQKLATAGLRRISALVAAVFTDNAGTGPTLADGKNVFDAAHHNSGTEPLSAEAWEKASAAIYNQPLLIPTGGVQPKQAVDARYLIVPRGLRLTAERILYPTLAYAPTIHSENLQRGHQGDVLTCPEFSDANDWAAVADPKLTPAIFIGERFGLLPEIYIADGQVSGALFTHDEVRIKARHFLSVFTADHRPLYKSNVAGE